MKKWSVLVLLAACLVSSALAEDGPLVVTGAWARATPPAAPTGAVYLTLQNAGDAEVALMGAATPAAQSAEIHRTSMHDGMMGMTPIAGLIITPGQILRLEPGGLHIMLMHLHEALKAGTTLELTLQFMGGGQQVVQVPVQEDAPATAEEQDHSH